MGKKGKEIVGLDVNKLVGMLNKALADEWLAYYQYWIGSKVVTGLERDAVIKELIQHAADELRHADMLVARIQQLEGTPILDPAEWPKLSGCGYAAPTDPSVRKILAQNIGGEQCAIGAYQELINFTKDKDHVTYQMAIQILADEVEHEDDLQTILEDLANK